MLPCIVPEVVVNRDRVDGGGGGGVPLGCGRGRRVITALLRLEFQHLLLYELVRKEIKKQHSHTHKHKHMYMHVPQLPRLSTLVSPPPPHYPPPRAHPSPASPSAHHCSTAHLGRADSVGPWVREGRGMGVREGGLDKEGDGGWEKEAGGGYERMGEG